VGEWASERVKTGPSGQMYNDKFATSHESPATII